MSSTSLAEVRVTEADRLVISNTDNPESISWLEDPSLLSLFKDGFESGDTMRWSVTVQ